MRMQSLLRKSDGKLVHPLQRGPNNRRSSKVPWEHPMTAEELGQLYAEGRRDVRGVMLIGADLRETELSGRTSTNVVVNLPGPAAWIGRTLPVRVERAGPHSVWGRPASEPAAIDRGTGRA